MDCKSASDQCYVRTGCVIMASGYGNRFGSNKLLTDFCGKPLLQWLLDATRGVFDKAVVVTRYPEIEALCHQQNLAVVLHSLPHQSDTIRLGLNAIGEGTDYCMFCPGDQPLLSKETLHKMVRQVRLKNSEDEIFRLSCHTHVGSPVIFPRKYYAELSDLQGDRGGSTILKKYPEKVCLFPAKDEFELFDVDCPADLEQLKKHFCSLTAN